MVGYWKRRDEMKMFFFDIGWGILRTQAAGSANCHAYVQHMENGMYATNAVPIT